jgi:hypothetical protein
VQPIKDSSLEAFGQWINSYDWSIVTRLPTVNQKLEMFTQVINSSVDTYFPKHTVKFHQEDKPFITGRIKMLIVNRDICGISKNQKINLVNPDSDEPLTSEESVECINDYLINLTKDYNKISNDLQLGGDDLDLPKI